MMNELRTAPDTVLYELLTSEQREQAFLELHVRYSTRIYAYCRKAAGDSTAEDLYQDVFLRLLKSADAGRMIENFPAYLLRIARNLILNQKRTETRNVVALEDITLSVPAYSSEAAECNEMITRALDLLPSDQREALMMQMYGNFSYPEIAEALDVPLTTVKNWIVRAKKRMREILAPYVNQE